MATPLDDSQSTPTAQNTPPAWTDWQAMRFLYQDVNSLLYGGGLDLQQFTLPSLNLPNYFNTFSLIQGIGSTNSGAGTTNQPGGGGVGGSIVLPCDIKAFANEPLNTLLSYIDTQGSFTIGSFISAIDSSLRALMLANPKSLLIGPLGTLATYVISPDIHIEFSVPVCGSPSCPNISDVTLRFRSDAIVYLSGYPPGDTTPDLRLYWDNALWNVGYTLTASIGSNYFIQNVDWMVAGPPLLTGGSVQFGGGVGYTLDPGVTWTQETLHAIYLDTMKILLNTTPTLQSGLLGILNQARCT